MNCYLVELSSDALPLSPIKVSLVVENVEDSNQVRTWGIVSQMASILSINITTFKGLLDKMDGVRVLREIPVLREMRKLGVVGSKAPSVALFPLDQLKEAITKHKKVDMDLLDKLVNLTPPLLILRSSEMEEVEGEKEREEKGERDEDWEPNEEEDEGWEVDVREGGDWLGEVVEEEEEEGETYNPACLLACLSDPTCFLFLKEVKLVRERMVD